jgi:hypothetical protein
MELMSILDHILDAKAVFAGSTCHKAPHITEVSDKDVSPGKRRGKKRTIEEVFGSGTGGSTL